ncbi:hypothetical protein GQ43DRAFT_471594 [Delitschia confertaspora ATCC 74209]|uniref:Exonuclease domain-containing protein n=1 Tax=Delitschia confertaspora ATCC 74209 TaxID=1513339 RepID=A0A9P4MQD0_9PLEO|nr:hypothetical protein GQ43DRAFT_471594 [Delitschia confertaspora ATCC 74209]
MWSSSSVFKQYPCPAGESCDLPDCIWGPHQQPATQEFGNPANRKAAQRPEEKAFVGSLTTRDISKSSTPTTETRKGTLSIGQSNSDVNIGVDKPALISRPKTKEALSSISRPVSPPPSSRKASGSTSTAASEKKEKLIPRKVTKDPVIFPKRIALLKMLYKEMARLNEQVSKTGDRDMEAEHLKEDEMIKLALDEEQKLARDHFAVYANLLKNRIAALKKMSLAVWVYERKASKFVEGQNAANKVPPPDPVQTGLNPQEELAVVPHLVCDQKDLDQFGYVTRGFTEEELAATRKGLESASHWEQCDRCGTRFQAFPDRREEDGALTTGGKCRYHWARPSAVKKLKHEIGPQKRHACCNGAVGSPGCVVHDTHVFKVNDEKRLWTIMPFAETPDNPAAKPHTAICFDCEMGYTSLGLELLRLTAVSWPTHKPVLDVLVRPLGAILDLNTRYSGIQPEQYFNAPPYDPKHTEVDPKNLQIVDSPAKARELFLSLISKDTPLIGHALENDLNTIRLIHPTIIDTVILFPHRNGLPYRHGLRALAEKFLNWKIQQGGASGHDSYEDARATGELVRYQVGKEWRKLKEQGWTIHDGELLPPLPTEAPPPGFSSAPAQSAVDPLVDAPVGAKQGLKRKIEESDDEDEEFTVEFVDGSGALEKLLRNE